METSAKTAMNVNDIFLAIGKFWNFLFCFCFCSLLGYYEVCSSVYTVLLVKSSRAINADGSNSYFSIFFKIH